ncbi:MULTISPECIES: hypothetical protein [unclassified Streptomyces]|uniref:hypothetical protein n=1 Tax=unclassified Streptomyces TaxID=2593676 RepID=UPI002741818C|nr:MULTISPECIES: hypothetical protein [unclassified Streptomyces]
MIDMIVGALQRVLVFRGWDPAIEQAVPAPNAAEYERLCVGGFASRLPAGQHSSFVLPIGTC